MAKQNKHIKSIHLRGTLSEEVGDYSNDPFVLRKVQAAKKRLDRIVLPRELLWKKKVIE